MPRNQFSIFSDTADGIEVTNEINSICASLGKALIINEYILDHMPIISITNGKELYTLF